MRHSLNWSVQLRPKCKQPRITTRDKGEPAAIDNSISTYRGPGKVGWHTCVKSLYTVYQAYVHTYIHACMHTYIHACVYIHACIYIHTYIHTYILLIPRWRKSMNLLLGRESSSSSSSSSSYCFYMCEIL